MQKEKIRKPVWAGSFYPHDPEVLRDTISRYLAAAPVLNKSRKIFGLIVPHAGYEYSGAIAAAGYKQVESAEFDTVVVIAPSHSEAFHGASVYDGDYYQTPLGLVGIDSEKADALVAASPIVHKGSSGHSITGSRAEHALEVQLPFLQVALVPGFKLIPIVIYENNLDNCRSLGNALAQLITEKDLVVASSDLYHGYAYDDCVQIDRLTLEAIRAMDVERFCEGVEDHSLMACGAGPIAALMAAAGKKGLKHVELLAQTNSALVTAIKGGWTVGYASLLFAGGERP